MLQLDKVTKVFSTGAFGSAVFPAVRQVSFEILPGQVTALIGESGSGKTTLGKMILRLESVSSGSIIFDGQDISRLKHRTTCGSTTATCRESSRTRSARITRSSGLTGSSKWSKDTYFSGVHSAAWHQKVEDAVQAVGLNPADVLNKFTHQLSGGQLQRLLVARALLLDLKLLVADEIISMLDASTRIDVLNLLADLKKRGLGGPLHHP